MNLDADDIRKLKPVIATTVAEVLEQSAANANKLSAKLALYEPDAAESIGIEPHALRDARLRGELKGSKCGRRTVYRIEELRRWLLDREVTR